MKLAYPLNDVLPNVEHTRDRLLAKVFEFRQTGLGKVITKDEDYELLYAYGESRPTLLGFEHPIDLPCSISDCAARTRPRTHWAGDRKIVRGVE